MYKKRLALPYLIWASIFTIVPVIIILYYSFFEKGVFTLEGYRQVLNPKYLGNILDSVGIAFISTVICLLLAYPLAMILSSKQMSGKSVILLLVILPMWMNSLLRTYAWGYLLQDTGVVNNFLNDIGLPSMQFLYRKSAIVFGNVYNFFPFMVLPIYNVLCKIDNSIIEASYDLGADKYTTFKKVILPLSMPGVITGIVMVFMPALTTFLVSRLLGGGKTTLLGDLIEQQFNKTGDWAFGSALSVILMIIILITLVFMSKKDSLDKGGGLF
ncbi:ABC transporter permease [Niameybacter massiliensis]|uniref:ABC transporter permease n=1 Tax=Holtiella tumoricola TaxID=3018743 RepID=A0AA42DNV5_9FIRM|nr:ABC transporter permease [Niameybacter massiliensis]MDA3732161.1 ABC transporter permease [Holtiella tumoricola]